MSLPKNEKKRCGTCAEFGVCKCGLILPDEGLCSMRGKVYRDISRPCRYWQPKKGDTKPEFNPETLPDPDIGLIDDYTVLMSRIKNVAHIIQDHVTDYGILPISLYQRDRDILVTQLMVYMEVAGYSEKLWKEYLKNLGVLTLP